MLFDATSIPYEIAESIVKKVGRAFAHALREGGLYDPERSRKDAEIGFRKNLHHDDPEVESRLLSAHMEAFDAATADEIAPPKGAIPVDDMDFNAMPLSEASRKMRDSAYNSVLMAAMETGGEIGTDEQVIAAGTATFQKSFRIDDPIREESLHAAMLDGIRDALAIVRKAVAEYDAIFGRN